MVNITLNVSVIRQSLSAKNLWNLIRRKKGEFPGGSVVKNPSANAGDTGSSPGPGRSHMPQSN